jgi:hypothetical protein
VIYTVKRQILAIRLMSALLRGTPLIVNNTNTWIDITGGLTAEMGGRRRIDDGALEGGAAPRLLHRLSNC